MLRERGGRRDREGGSSHAERERRQEGLRERRREGGKVEPY